MTAPDPTSANPENPLLAPAGDAGAPAAGAPSGAPSRGLPAFDRVRPEHAEPALDAVIAENRARLATILGTGRAAGAGAGAGAGVGPAAAGWERVIAPLEDMDERIGRAWGPVSHLFSVQSTAAWRKAYNAGLPKVTAYHLERSQDEALFRAYEAIGRGEDFASFSPARKKVIHDALRDFRLSGVALPAAEKARFREVALRLSQLQSKFEENLIDAVQAFGKDVPNEAALAGMTEQGRAAAREKARAKGLPGFRLTLDYPSYDAVISYADDRDLRRELYEAYATRASDEGPLAGRFDNSALMTEILALRHEQARLLGMKSFAEVSLATKMAGSPDEVERFLVDLNARARPRARAELGEIAALAKSRDGVTDVAPWDLPYYSEKLRRERLGYSDEELRPYFPLSQALGGLFDLVQRLYGVRVEPIAGVPTWHPDVTTYALREASGDEIGVFYLDPYAREDKRGGAWMDECVPRRRTRAGLQRPAAYLTCNFAPPVAGRPALLSHLEVLTLFHEFGHGLQHLLTRVDEAAVSGIRGVAWDAVELPSQFMENWCYDPPTLRRFARHFESGAPLPDALTDKLRAARSFQSGLATVRQIEFALFDLRLHRDHDPARGARVLDVLAEVRREVSVLPPPAWNRMPNSFSHIFAGGYAAGYYSYKWAEVLSADAFSAFEESGFAPATGQRFRDTVLAQGGSREAMDIFVDFRGRRPSIAPLLAYAGL